MAGNQITGGAFQDLEGNPLSFGYLVFMITADAQIPSVGQVCGGSAITVPLDINGNISGTVVIWPNDILIPNDTEYFITAYSEKGQQVWQSTQQILSTPSPFSLN